MNELDWLAGADPLAMLEYIGAGATDRKLRLFACACVRPFWADLSHPGPREAVAMAERLAEGAATAEEVEAMRVRADAAAENAPHFERYSYRAAAQTLAEQASEAARLAPASIGQHAFFIAAFAGTYSHYESEELDQARREEARRQAELLNELFGNPFRPVTVEPQWLAWNDGVVVRMAREIEADQRFAELPYLADALMDAGCDADALLCHLRREGGHLRGCWALDALLL